MQEIRSQPATDRQTFSTQPPPLKKKSGKKWIILVLVLILIAVLSAVAYFLFRSPQEETPKQPFPEPTPVADSQEPSPTPTPEPVVRDEVSLEVLNGTGIAGEAALLREKLKELGYSEIKVGNAQGEARETTEVSFATSVPEPVRNEILSLLKQTYVEVDVTSTQGEGGVRIITGLRTGQTLPTPTPTSAPTPTVTESPSPTATPTPTPTPIP